MNKILSIFTIALVVSFTSVAEAGRGGGSRGGSSGGSRSRSSSSDHVVRGYTTKRGTYVAPHHQSNRDGVKGNNYSTKGNVNPYTGKVGTK